MGPASRSGRFRILAAKQGGGLPFRRFGLFGGLLSIVHERLPRQASGRSRQVRGGVEKTGRRQMEDRGRYFQLRPVGRGSPREKSSREATKPSRPCKAPCEARLIC